MLAQIIDRAHQLETKGDDDFFFVYSAPSAITQQKTNFCVKTKEKKNRSPRLPQPPHMPILDFILSKCHSGAVSMQTLRIAFAIDDTKCRAHNLLSFSMLLQSLWFIQGRPTSSSDTAGTQLTQWLCAPFKNYINSKCCTLIIIVIVVVVGGMLCVACRLLRKVNFRSRRASNKTFLLCSGAFFVCVCNLSRFD